MRPHRSVRGLLVVRCLLLSNGLLLAALGGLYLLFGARPAGYVIGVLLGLAAVALWLAVPLTDPYRSDRLADKVAPERPDPSRLNSAGSQARHRRV